MKQQAKSSGGYHYFTTSQKGCLSAKRLMKIPLFPILVLLLTSPLAKAQVSISPRVATGVMFYEYDVGIEGKTSELKDKVHLNEELPFVGLGATLAHKRFFMDVYVQTTVMEKDIQEQGEKLVGNVLTSTDYTRNTELERQDYTLSFGYAMTNHLSAFAGYQYGDTGYDWNENVRDENGGDVGTVFKTNEFLSGGLFIGVGGNLQIGPGSLGINVALADLDGKITTNRSHEPGNSNITTLVIREREEKVSSSTTGVKLGINWNAPITQRLSYSVSLDWFNYKFDARKGHFQDSVFGNQTHELLDLDSFEVEETVYSIRASLNYRF